jgi:hypothetical protein
MQEWRAVAGCGFLGLVLSCATGCSTLVKQAYYEVRGAEAELLWVQQPPPGTFAGAGKVTFAPVTTTVGPLIAPGLMAAYDAAARQTELVLTSQYAGGGAPLRIETDVIYFQRKGLLSGALFLARLRLDLDGAAAGDALLKVESKAYSAGDEEALAQAALKVVREYFQRLRPVPAGTPNETRAR